jgi:hypothetical protein
VSSYPEDGGFDFESPDQKKRVQRDGVLRLKRGEEQRGTDPSSGFLIKQKDELICKFCNNYLR